MHRPQQCSHLRIGKAWSLVRNISMGEMTVALNVRANDPARRGAGVRVAFGESVNSGEITPSRYS